MAAAGLEFPNLQTSPEVDLDKQYGRHKHEAAKYDVMRSSIVDSIHRSRVIRDISPKRVYACNKEAHAALPALFKQEDGLKHLRPLHKEGREGNDSGPRHPRLLQRLEFLLEEKLRLADQLSNPFADVSKIPSGAANMRLDAHRQAFEAFIHSFTTYRPLLLRIKAQYDMALEDALESVHENVHMKAELAVIEQRRLRAVEEARVAASNSVSESRRELENRLMAMEERAAAAETLARAAEAEARAARAEEEKAIGEREEYLARVKDLRQEMLANSAWGKALTEKEKAHNTRIEKSQKAAADNADGKS